MKPYVLAYLVMSGCLFACGGSSADDPSLTVAKEVESIQCETKPEPIAQLDAALARANVVPTKKYCAWDGTDRGFACGLKTFYLRVIEIPESQSNAASELGYRSTQRYDRLIPIECAQ